MFELLRKMLIESNFQLGCPVATIGLEAPSEGLRQIAGNSYRAWEDLLAALLKEFGYPMERSMALLCLVEGALLIAKTQKSLRAVEAAEQAALEWIR